MRKNVLITGASGGIGSALALAFAEEATEWQCSITAGNRRPGKLRSGSALGEARRRSSSADISP